MCTSRAIVLLLLAATAACSTGTPDADQLPAVRPPDTVATADRAVAPPVAIPTTDTLVGLAPDTLAIAPLDRAATVTPAVRAAPIATPDTTSIVASDADLERLRRALIIPVLGKTRNDIHDTYTEARVGHTHEALDILAARGTPVISATDGKVVKLFTSVPGGLMVYAGDVSDQFILMYGHLDRYADGIVAGMPLKQGQVIGYVGTTGNAPISTPHLHFALARGRPSVAWWKGTPINPYPLLAAPPR